MYLPMGKAETILRLLVEGNSISSIERITGVHHSTILKLLVLSGARCEKLLEDKIQGLDVTDVQGDELWSFIQKKEGHKWPWEANDTEIGDSYCFIAIERKFKLILAWQMGRRTKADTEEFTGKLRRATSEKNLPTDHGRIQALRRGGQSQPGRQGGFRATHQSVHPRPRRPAPVQPAGRNQRGGGPSLRQPRPGQDLH
jgi:IS1 family transposase